MATAEANAILPTSQQSKTSYNTFTAPNCRDTGDQHEQCTSSSPAVLTSGSNPAEIIVKDSHGKNDAHNFLQDDDCQDSTINNPNNHHRTGNLNINKIQSNSNSDIRNTTTPHLFAANTENKVHPHSNGDDDNAITYTSDNPTENPHYTHANHSQTSDDHEDRSPSINYAYLGYITLFFINFGEVGTVTSAQLAVGKTSVFQLNVIRFALQSSVVFAFALIRHAYRGGGRGGVIRHTARGCEDGDDFGDFGDVVEGSSGKQLGGDSEKLVADDSGSSCNRCCDNSLKDHTGPAGEDQDSYSSCFDNAYSCSSSKSMHKSSCIGYISIFRIARRDWGYVLTAAVCDYIYGCGTYIAAAFLPVGSIQGVSMSLYIVLTVAFDVVRGLARRSSVLCGVVACTGIIFLTQPWRFEEIDHPKNSCAVCDYLDGMRPLNDTCSWEHHNVNDSAATVEHKLINMSQGLAIDPFATNKLRDTDLQSAFNSASNWSTKRELIFYIAPRNLQPRKIKVTKSVKYKSEDKPIVYFRQSKNGEMGDLKSYKSETGGHTYQREYKSKNSWSHSPIFGYLLVAISAISAAISSNCCHRLVSLYQVPVVVTWTASIEFTLTLTITLILNAATHTPWGLPSGPYCLLFSLVFPCLSCFTDLLWYVAFSYISVSQVSLGSAPTVVTLYILQKTVLSQFFPGYSNFLEPIGAALAFGGVAMMPIIHMCTRKRQYKQIDCE